MLTTKINIKVGNISNCMMMISNQPVTQNKLQHDSTERVKETENLMKHFVNIYFINLFNELKLLLHCKNEEKKIFSIEKIVNSLKFIY